MRLVSIPLAGTDEGLWTPKSRRRLAAVREYGKQFRKFSDAKVLQFPGAGNTLARVICG